MSWIFIKANSQGQENPAFIMPMNQHSHLKGQPKTRKLFSEDVDCTLLIYSWSLALEVTEHMFIMSFNCPHCLSIIHHASNFQELFQYLFDCLQDLLLIKNTNIPNVLNWTLQKTIGITLSFISGFGSELHCEISQENLATLTLPWAKQPRFLPETT